MIKIGTTKRVSVEPKIKAKKMENPRNIWLSSIRLIEMEENIKSKFSDLGKYK